ncbi:protein-disulfide reductase DsbD domain-containing protein [Mucilaginibacter sp.]|jgi:thiol:disulfide interchange protein DsbD|uniref:protein-disulfide reductase DsbD domain-containing protein n=1 Tax=Mucilaginibacter sp. TaxID=1882438 RepID=UPI00356973E0
MKNILIVCTFLFVSLNVFGQTKSPVSWSFTSHKKSDKVYEVVMSATVAKPWHIYSQFTPDGGPLPTKITFSPNPLLLVEKIDRETGNLKTVHDKTFDVDVKYFSDKAQFVKTIKVKGAVKTNVRGTIEYMVCNDAKCLPPVKQSFDIKLQ